MSQLALVDLAGSERTLRTGTAGDRLREAGICLACSLSMSGLVIVRRHFTNKDDKFKCTGSYLV